MISEGGISVGEETSRIPVVIIQFYQLFQLSESAATRKVIRLLLIRLQEVAHLRVLCFKFEFLNPSKYNDTQHLDFIVGIKFTAFMQNNKSEVPILSHVFDFV